VLSFESHDQALAEAKKIFDLPILDLARRRRDRAQEKGAREA
jgi:hypothetical protein